MERRLNSEARRFLASLTHLPAAQAVARKLLLEGCSVATCREGFRVAAARVAHQIAHEATAHD